MFATRHCERVTSSEFLVRKSQDEPDGRPAFFKIKSKTVGFTLPAQPIDATHALNLSAGVSNLRVLRGRSLSWRATLFR